MKGVTDDSHFEELCKDFTKNVDMRSVYRSIQLKIGKILNTSKLRSTFREMKSYPIPPLHLIQIVVACLLILNDVREVERYCLGHPFEAPQNCELPPKPKLVWELLKRHISLNIRDPEYIVKRMNE